MERCALTGEKGEENDWRFAACKFFRSPTHSFVQQTHSLFMKPNTFVAVYTKTRKKEPAIQRCCVPECSSTVLFWPFSPLVSLPLQAVFNCLAGKTEIFTFQRTFVWLAENSVILGVLNLSRVWSRSMMTCLLLTPTRKIRCLASKFAFKFLKRKNFKWSDLHSNRISLVVVGF